MIFRRVLPLFLIALVPLACSGSDHRTAGPMVSTQITRSTTTAASSAIAIPTEAPSSIHMDALLRGPLNSDGQCFWIGKENVHAEVVIWPSGYRAATNPLRIIDNTGHVFARVGQVVSLGGGGVPTNLTPKQLVAAYPPLRKCLPEMACYSRPTQIGCLNDVWAA